MERKRPYWMVAVSLLFSLFATFAFVIIGYKAIVFFMPFVVGWILSSIATPVVNWLERRFSVVKKLGTALVVVLVIAAIVAVLYFAVSYAVKEVVAFIRDLPENYERIEGGLRQIGGTFSGMSANLPEGVQNAWNTAFNNLDQYIGELIAGISEPTMEAAGSFAMRLPSVLIAFIMVLLSAYFFTVQRDEVLNWCRKVAPPAVAKRMAMVMDNLRYAVGGYFKAQFKIMGVVFLILLVGFGLLKVRYYALVAFLVAFLDFLPFFGTGTALIPWAVYEVFTGQYKMVLFLLALYAITQICHRALEPKMVADSVGLNPLLTLVFLYIGYKVSSVIGMILAVPLGMVVINMYKAGAFDYILDDVKVLADGIMGLRGLSPK